MDENLKERVKKYTFYKKISALEPYSREHFKENLENVLSQKFYKEGGKIIEISFNDKNEKKLKDIIKDIFDKYGYFINHVIKKEENDKTKYVILLPGFKEEIGAKYFEKYKVEELKLTSYKEKELRKFNF